MARGTCLRFLSAAALFAAEAVVGMTLLAVAPQPAGAQLFDDRFPAIPLYSGNPWFLPLVGAYYQVQDWLR